RGTLTKAAECPYSHGEDSCADCVTQNFVHERFHGRTSSTRCRRLRSTATRTTPISTGAQARCPGSWPAGLRHARLEILILVRLHPAIVHFSFVDNAPQRQSFLGSQVFGSRQMGQERR